MKWLLVLQTAKTNKMHREREREKTNSTQPDTAADTLDRTNSSGKQKMYENGERASVEQRMSENP